MTVGVIKSKIAAGNSTSVRFFQNRISYAKGVFHIGKANISPFSVRKRFHCKFVNLKLMNLLYLNFTLHIIKHDFYNGIILFNNKRSFASRA